MKKLKKWWKGFLSNLNPIDQFIYIERKQIDKMTIEECLNKLDNNYLSLVTGNLIIKRKGL